MCGRFRRLNWSWWRLQVREEEAVAFHRLAGLERDRRIEHWPSISEGMEFAILATRINGRREIGEKLVIEFPSCQSAWHGTGVDADDAGFQAASNHFCCELCGISFPKR